MDDDYQDLREAISSSNEELRRFRQLVVNSVMATDIMDKELKALRDARWERAFLGSSSASTESSRDSVNRKATIVIEHLIQASDVAHTMQVSSERDVYMLLKDQGNSSRELIYHKNSTFVVCC